MQKFNCQWFCDLEAFDQNKIGLIYGIYYNLYLSSGLWGSWSIFPHKLLCLSFIESSVVTVKGFQLFKSYQSSVCTMDRLKKHLLKFKLQMFHKNCDGWRYAKVGVMYANMWVTQMSE